MYQTFCNTQVRVLIKNRIKCNAMRGRILFNCPPLNEFFPTSTFELDLTSGQVHTFCNPAEDIGIPCQQEEFDLEALAEKLQKDPDRWIRWIRKNTSNQENSSARRHHGL